MREGGRVFKKKNVEEMIMIKAGGGDKEGEVGATKAGGEAKRQENREFKKKK